MNIAIIGCGFIGRKRANAMCGSRLVACADVVAKHAEALAEGHAGAVAATNWQDVVGRDDVDIVIVATVHKALAEITLAAVEAGKHVLVEKPAARRAGELDPVIEAAKRKDVLVHVGFNHRYHPALLKAQELVNSGQLGELMYIRGRYGHGGRVGYDKEWRAKPELSGGGELIDQGMHLIDLSRLFLGEFPHVDGFVTTYFWDMPVEDNGFVLLRTASNQVAWLHATWTEWKNMFSFEISGRKGKLDIFGLGGSYGTERITFYRMHETMGPPETMAWEYPQADNSWATEFREFLEDIRLGRQPAAGLGDAQAALRIIETLYRL